MSMLFAPRKPQTTVFMMFFAAGSKKHGIYSVFWLVPSKNTCIYLRSFQHVARSMPQAQAYCKLPVVPHKAVAEVSKTGNL